MADPRNVCVQSLQVINYFSEMAFQFSLLRDKFERFAVHVVLIVLFHSIHLPYLSECEVDKISFDDIIDNAGGFGSWQMIIFFMISSFDVFAAFSVMLPVFTGKTICFFFFKKILSN